MIIELPNGHRHAVNFHQLSQKDMKKYGIYKASRRKTDGWDFDWHEPLKQGFQVFALFVDREPSVVQGLIALKPNLDPTCLFIEVAIIESAPKNKVRNLKRNYSGVGEHLMAFACRLGFMHGFDGYVHFKSKTTTVTFYEKIGAKHIGNGVMYLNTHGASTIIRRCGL
jgi:hypothetical protein